MVSSNLPMKKYSEDVVAIFDEMPKENLTLRHHVKPLSVFKDEGIVKQKYDYSCGSAALATLLNSYLHENLSEHQVIQGLMQYGDSKQIEEKRAFSLLDMKRFTSALGYKGAGYTAEIEDLKALKTPAILPIEIFGYKHFVVYRGIYKDHVFFADPFMGNISFPIGQFRKMWYQNIVFIVTDENIKFNALALKESDLRIVHFDMTKYQPFVDAYNSLVTDEQNLIETYGKWKFVTINVR
jgi:uncharacterized protein